MNFFRVVYREGYLRSTGILPAAMIPRKDLFFSRIIHCIEFPGRGKASISLCEADPALCIHR